MRIKLIQRIIDIIRQKRTKCNILDYGKNNKIYIKTENNKNLINICIYGDNNEVVINADERFCANINIGTIDSSANNCKFYAGYNTSCNGLSARLCENNSSIIIEDGSMLAAGINIMCSDTHSVLDLEGNLINYGKNVNIGEHVWVGNNVTILKNTTIPNNCIIGMQSVVASSFNEENCVIAGNPARIVKRKVKWDKLRPNNYIQSKT